MRPYLVGFGMLLLLWTVSCEEVDQQKTSPALQIKRQGVATRDLFIENQSLDKELKKQKLELEKTQKIAEAQKSDIEKLLKEKGQLTEQHSAAASRAEKLMKELEKQTTALQQSTQTSDRLSRENESLRKEIDGIRKELAEAKKAAAPPGSK